MSGNPDDPAERTVFQPGKPAGGAQPQGFPAPGAPAAPGGYVPPSPQPAAGEQPARASGGQPARLDFAAAEPDLYGPEPLVAAAGRLIHLASQVRTMPVGPDLAGLRQLVIRELDAFGPRAQKLGLDAKTVQLAHYILCAFLDDAVMSTPWGANSPWSQHSLLAAYHNDVQGGDRLFQFAERMEADPAREPRLMELLYQCLSLGFEGRAALDPRGASLLQQRRSRLAAAIAGRTGAPAAELSPQWRGVVVAGGSYAPRVPLWAIVAGLATIAMMIFAALLFRLSSQSDGSSLTSSQVLPIAISRRSLIAIAFALSQCPVGLLVLAPSRSSGSEQPSKFNILVSTEVPLRCIPSTKMPTDLSALPVSASMFTILASLGTDWTPGTYDLNQEGLGVAARAALMARWGRNSDTISSKSLSATMRP